MNEDQWEDWGREPKKLGFFAANWHIIVLGIVLAIILFVVLL